MVVVNITVDIRPFEMKGTINPLLFLCSWCSAMSSQNIYHQEDSSCCS